MLTIVADLLKEFEEKHNITIIYAVESGSRAWGYSSNTSDFDIRFIYHKNDMVNYITSNKTSDTLCGSKDEIEWQGWDLLKAVGHLKESNPSMIEFLYSPIIYVNKNEFREECLKITKDMHTHLSLMYHYYNMARKNWTEWIEGKDEVLLKKYFYVIRPIATLQYILHKYVTCPDKHFDLITDLNELLIEIKESISGESFNEIETLLKKKKTNYVKGEKGTPFLKINDWIIKQFLDFENVVAKKSDTMSIVDNDVNFKFQSLISFYKKIDNETKKILALTSKNGKTARSNYLTAIGFALQFIWLHENPNEDSNNVPKKISHLLKNEKIIKCVNLDIIDEIKKIIDVLTTEIDEKTQLEINMEYDKIYETFLLPQLKYAEDIKNYDIKKRHDIVEYMFKNFVNILWLLGNNEESQSNLPKDILNLGDPTCTVNDKLIEKLKMTANKIRPKFIVETNKIINDWLQNLLKYHEKTINDTKDKILKIRDINAQKRYNSSLKNINIERFDDLIKHVLVKKK